MDGEAPRLGFFLEDKQQCLTTPVGPFEQQRHVELAKAITQAIAKVVSANHTVFGWTTHGHTGEDVALWSYGPMAPIGQIDNTDLGRAVAEAFALNLDLGDPQGLNQSLFIDAEEAFPGLTRTDLSDPENPVLEIANWRLPANKDEMLSPQQRICQFEGLTVYAPEANNGFGRWFIPRAAIEIGTNPSLQSRACR